MYSKVAICKTCQTRVLDEQMDMTAYGHPNKCIYCLITNLSKDILTITRKRDDLFFSFQILEHSYSEVHAAYEAAIQDNKDKQEEIANLQVELLNYEKSFYYVDPSDPMVVKKRLTGF